MRSLGSVQRRDILSRASARRLTFRRSPSFSARSTLAIRRPKRSRKPADRRSISRPPATRKGRRQNVGWAGAGARERSALPAPHRSRPGDGRHCLGREEKRGEADRCRTVTTATIVAPSLPPSRRRRRRRWRFHLRQAAVTRPARTGAVPSILPAGSTMRQCPQPETLRAMTTRHELPRARCLIPFSEALGAECARRSANAHTHDDAERGDPRAESTGLREERRRGETRSGTAVRAREREARHAPPTTLAAPFPGRSRRDS